LTEGGYREAHCHRPDNCYQSSRFILHDFSP
jgi:hypothetical protein